MKFIFQTRICLTVFFTFLSFGAIIGEELYKGDVSIEARRHPDDHVDLVVTLPDSSAGETGVVRVSFGTGQANDQSRVIVGEAGDESILRLRATREDMAIDESLEVAILDDGTVQIECPQLEPKFPEISCSIDLEKMGYKKAFNGREIIGAREDVTPAYLAGISEAGYWVFFDGAGYPPLVVSGFSGRHVVQLLSGGGTFSKFFSPNETVRFAFLKGDEVAVNQGALEKAAQDFVEKFRY